MTPNKLVYPLLAQYLDELPQRLDSFPAVLTRADFSLILRERLSAVLPQPGLPAGMRATLMAPWKQGDWIPMTVYVALCAIARDQLWKSDEEYHQGMLHVAVEMYKGPMYRALFVMFGPSLVAMSATKRWHTLHQGTELVMKKMAKQSVDLRLTYPAKLMSEVAVRSLGAAFCAIAHSSRGKDPTFTLSALEPTYAEMVIHWVA